MAKTKVMPCDCTSITIIKVKAAGDRSGARWEAAVPFHTRANGAEFQDKKYGKGMRLHNLTDKQKEAKASCTVCGKVKNL